MTLLTQLLTTLNAKINEVKNEIPSITNLSSNTALNAKINDVKNKLPNITNLANITNLILLTNQNMYQFNMN